MITTDRNVSITAHLTSANKEKFRAEAQRRHISMSELISIVLEKWLMDAPDEKLIKTRSNKRLLNPNEEDVPLPLDEP